MATKFYTNHDTELYVPPAWQGGWTNPSPFSRCILDTESYGSATSYPYFQIGNTNPPSSHKTFLWTGVSRVLQPQTISGTMNLVTPAYESNALNNARTRVHIWVVNATTNTVFATLLNQFEDITAPEWTVWPTTGTTLSTSQTLAPCTIPNDGNIYRLVIEFGAVSTPAPGSIYQIQTAAGSRARANQALLPDAIVGGFGIEYNTIITFSHDFLLVPLTTLPINKTIDTAIDLGSLPITSTYNSIGPYYHWFKTSSPGDFSVSAIACNITPRNILMDIYLGDLADNEYMIGTYYKNPILFPTKTGDSIFLRMQTYQSLTGDSVSFDIVQAPSGPVEIGDLLVLSDNSGPNYYDPTMPGSSPAVWYNTVDGSHRLVTERFIASELGISFANGKLAIADQKNDKIFIYDKAPDLTELHRFSMPPDPMWPDQITYPEVLGTDFVSLYVGTHDDVGNKIIFKFSESGVLDPRIWHLPSDGDYGYVAGGGDPSIGITRDSKILYWGNYALGGKCHRHDMVNDTEILPAFTPPMPTSGAAYRGGEVIVLKDNSIVCLFVNGGIPKHKLVHYSPTGIILREVPYWDDGVIDDLTLHHICHNSEYDMKVWIFHNTDGNRFQLLNLETGVIEKDFDNKYVDNPPLPGTCIPSGPRYESSGSCPLMVMMRPFNPIIMTDISGIYNVVPRDSITGPAVGRHDSYYDTSVTPAGKIDVKIPDPIIRTALFGE